MKRVNFWIGAGLAFVLSIAIWQPVLAAGPEGERRVAFGSTNIACQVVGGNGVAESAQLTVDLGTWEGQVEAADLELVIGGTRAEHSIYVNGRRIAKTSVRPQEYVCGSEPDWFATDSLAIPLELLNQGENTITLTNDGDIDDAWTAANIQITIHGNLRKPIPPEGVSAPLPITPGIGAQAVVSGTVDLPSTYELALGNNISQMVAYQIPDGYTGATGVPLVIIIHGMRGNAIDTRNLFAPEANSRGWLLAAPYMHGAYYQTPPNSAKSLAWVGAQHDIIDTINYMIEHWEVDKSRIYLIGGSMGGQTTTMGAAKYPDIFAAVVAWKPLTDLTDWYNDLGAMTPQDPYNNRLDIRRETGAGVGMETDPTQAPFEYQRRSPMMMPQNDPLVPMTMWHDVDDYFVPIYHSRDLRDALNSWRTPAYTIVLTEVDSGANQCAPADPYEHCYVPPTSEVADFLNGKTRSSNPPSALNIRTDESKSYFWLNLAQTGENHWSEVAASYANQTVSATISDTQPLTVAFNLGSAPIMDVVGIGQAGMGLPATTYLVRENGTGSLANYTSGYFTKTLSTTGQFSLTISAITVTVSASPSFILADGVTTTTLTIAAKDQLNNPVPDGTNVQMTTTRGAFAGSAAVELTGGSGQIVLTSSASPGLADITATVGSVSGSTTVNMPSSLEKTYLPIVIK